LNFPGVTARPGEITPLTPPYPTKAQIAKEVERVTVIIMDRFGRRLLKRTNPTRTLEWNTGYDIGDK
jgi:hypothetical protein